MTPAPPRGVLPEAVIEQSDTILDGRESELEKLKCLLAQSPQALLGNQECKELRDAIALLDTQWKDALDWARRELANQRLAGQRARQNQRSYRSAG